MSEEFWIKAQDGIDLYARSWDPEGAAKGVVCLVHGLGEHCNRYHHVAKALNQAGYGVVAIDHRGHGQSQGPRGYSPSYETVMQDIARLIEEGKRRYPGAPVFLYGHSMGGNFVINYALRKKTGIRGVIATGPALRTAFDPPPVKIAVGRALYAIYPRLTMSNELDVNGLSRDTSVVKAYTQDPLVHDRITARLAIDILDAGLWALAHAGELSVPLLLMHGSADRLTSAKASQEFAAQAPKQFCTLKIWDGFFHEIHNEVEQKEVLDVAIHWLNERI